MSQTDDATAQRATSARTLTIAAGVSLLLGMMVGSPAGAMFGYGLAAVTALAATLLARGRARWVALAVWVTAFGLACFVYPEFGAHMAGYRRH